MPPLVSLTKWQLMNKRRNWIQMSVTTRGSAFVWSCREGSLLQPSGKWSWHVISGNSCTCPLYEPRNVGCFLRAILRLELRIFLQILDVKCEKSVGYPLKTLSFLSFFWEPSKKAGTSTQSSASFLGGKVVNMAESLSMRRPWNAIVELYDRKQQRWLAQVSEIMFSSVKNSFAS